MVGYLHPEDDNSARADKARVKVVKHLAKELGFKFPVKLEKKKPTTIIAFGCKNQEEYSIYVSEKTLKRNVNLLLIGERSKRYYVLIKDFNTFMYDHTLHHGRKHFCCYYLQASITVKIQKSQVNNCLIIINKLLTFLKKVNILDSKISKRKKK